MTYWAKIETILQNKNPRTLRSAVGSRSICEWSIFLPDSRRKLHGHQKTLLLRSPSREKVRPGSYLRVFPCKYSFHIGTRLCPVHSRSQIPFGNVRCALTELPYCEVDVIARTPGRVRFLAGASERVRAVDGSTLSPGVSGPTSISLTLIRIYAIFSIRRSAN